MAIAGKSVAALLGLGVAAHGFARGLNSSGAESAFFESVSGNPNLDTDILGTNIKASTLFLPHPMPTDLDIALHGLPGARSGIPKLMALLPSGLLNRKMLNAGFAGANRPFTTEVPPAFSNEMPNADGSLVFGMYNSRYGR